MCYALQHLILEFLVCCDTGVFLQHGEIDVRRVKDGTLALDFGGVLVHECTCWIKRMAAEYQWFETDCSTHGNALLAFAIAFEQYCVPEMTERERTNFTECRQCRKSKAGYHNDSATSRWFKEPGSNLAN